MQMEKQNQKNIVILCGTASLEHEVSLCSAYFVAKELATLQRYNLMYVAITKSGAWKYAHSIDALIKGVDSVNTIYIDESASVLDVFQIGSGKINDTKIDCVFLTTHGKYGEDGNLQGFLTINGIPYAGCDVVGSVNCFNKNICKYVAEAHCIRTVPYICLHKSSDRTTIADQVAHLGDTYIVKINRGGSSIGVFKCTRDSLMDTVEHAFTMDDVLLIEKYLPVREVFIGMVNNKGTIDVGDIGEVLTPPNSICDFSSKYESTSAYYSDTTLTPAISDTCRDQIRATARTLFQILELKGYARIDFFLHNDILYLNEINTLPGTRCRDACFIKSFSSKYSPRELFSTIIETRMS